MKPILYVGNRNYSSWSLRAWLALAWSRLDFETRVIQLGGPGYAKRAIPEVLAVAPSGTVPVLHIGNAVIGDSLAISEWVAEQVPTLWPAHPIERAVARSAACEMHSGFPALRANLTCNIRRRAEPRDHREDVRADIERVEALWTSIRGRYGGRGPYLFGSAPTIADAFFTPVATRLRTYAVSVNPVCQQYADALLANPAFRAWEAEAIEEPWTIPSSDGA